jgi:aspartyl-tRNA(Asn)/glutamyl-tRNA(Gln) amidotransferase subunit A
MLQRRHISSRELTDACLARIEELNPKLNSFITVAANSARDDAARADSEIKAGNYRGPLHGIPISIKDVFATKNLRTTAGSKVLADWVPTFDAEPVARLRAAGAIILGKNHMHEFAYGVSSDNPHYGPARDPWDPTRIPGGSSGGSAIAVATSQGFASLASDTGGSIRIPSAICGTVGIKPTYGRVSKRGAIPLSWTLDHVGPITKCVEDAAILLNVLAGHDPQDPTSSTAGVPDYRSKLKMGVRGMKLGVPREYFFDHVDDEIASSIKRAIQDFKRLGAEVVEVSIGNLEPCSAAEAHITLVEALCYHEKYLEKQADAYGEGVRTDLEAGYYLLGTDYVKSQQYRSLLRSNFAHAFESVDAIVSPTLPAFPPKVGEVWVQSGDLREHIIDAFLRFAIPYDLSGLPAVTVRCGFSKDDLPIGLQLAGPAFAESRLLAIAAAYEQGTYWHRRVPAV